MSEQREVVILSGVRTAIGDYGGSLKDIAPSELAARVVKEAVGRAKIDPKTVGQCVIGNVIHTEPKATLVQPVDRSDQTAYVGGGIRFYLTRRFFLRGEYKNHIIFTKRNENEKVDEWKVGFAFFF